MNNAQLNEWPSQFTAAVLRPAMPSLCYTDENLLRLGRWERRGMDGGIWKSLVRKDGTFVTLEPILLPVPLADMSNQLQDSAEC